MNKKIKIIGNSNTFAEIYSSGIEYHMLNNKLEAMYNGILCKDFLNEAFLSEFTHKDYSIYNFSSKYSETNFIKSKFFHISIMNCVNKYAYSYTNITEQQCDNLKSFISQIENMLGFKQSTISMFSKDEILFPPKYNKANAVLVKFSREWIKYPYLLSLFTTFLRIGLLYYNETSNALEFIKNFNYNSNDSAYLKGVIQQLEVLLTQKVFVKKEWVHSDNIYEIHNNSGFVNVLQENINFFKNYRKEI